MNKILVVDDELSIRESFSLILEGKYKLLLAASGEAALQYVADQKIDLVYLDIRMPGLDGLETLSRLKEIDPEVEVIMVTAVNDVSKASLAIKNGARDYIIKPFDVAAILKLTESILRRKNRLAESKAIKKEASKSSLRLVGQSEKIEQLIKNINLISPKTLRVLVLGEPGTEKEETARLVHEKSSRAELPFCAISLSAGLTGAEIKNRLFGSGKGSTTLELKKQSGLVEEARGGTLYINNVEYLPNELLALFPSEVRLIGSGQPDLADKAKEVFEFFSEVLLALPPLRERLSDLPVLLDHFLAVYNQQFGRAITEIPKAIEELFSDQAWPGNIAEFKAALKSLVLNSKSDRLELNDLPLDFLLKSSGSPGADFLSNFEKEYIEKTLEEFGGDRERSAAVLGVNPSLIELKA